MSSRSAAFASAAAAAAGIAAMMGALAACGGARNAPPATNAARQSDAGVTADDATGSSASASESHASLEALSARGPSEAPLMRELLRVARTAPRSPDVRADRDLCVRAVFSAARPVRAWFVDAAGATRGEIATGASGTVPPRGPACATKGEVLHLVVEGSDGTSTADTTARAVIFAAP